MDGGNYREAGRQRWSSKKEGKKKIKIKYKYKKMEKV